MRFQMGVLVEPVRLASSSSDSVVSRCRRLMSSGAFLTSRAAAYVVSAAVVKAVTVTLLYGRAIACASRAPPSLLVSYCRWLVLGLTTFCKGAVCPCAAAFYRHFVYINRSVLN